MPLFHYNFCPLHAAFRPAPSSATHEDNDVQQSARSADVKSVHFALCLPFLIFNIACIAQNFRALMDRKLKVGSGPLPLTMSTPPTHSLLDLMDLLVGGAG
ncbi:hypothetical protein PoB_003094800 [Plakobranchus ocellatus]|uniref:Uncharacterized protein n=1 Tax=Plakobranchus ocellatus TaxID=259542 RepID=A0AAV4ACE6_9GAST|nr:hypothetical protein PoB_003094800 [Plakobranchus ocellatus]